MEEVKMWIAKIETDLLEVKNQFTLLKECSKREAQKKAVEKQAQKEAAEEQVSIFCMQHFVCGLIFVSVCKSSCVFFLEINGICQHVVWAKRGCYTEL